VWRLYFAIVVLVIVILVMPDLGLIYVALVMCSAYNLYLVPTTRLGLLVSWWLEARVVTLETAFGIAEDFRGEMVIVLAHYEWSWERL